MLTPLHLQGKTFIIMLTQLHLQGKTFMIVLTPLHLQGGISDALYLTVMIISSTHRSEVCSLPQWHYMGSVCIVFVGVITHYIRPVFKGKLFPDTVTGTTLKLIPWLGFVVVFVWGRRQQAWWKVRHWTEWCAASWSLPGACRSSVPSSSLAPLAWPLAPPPPPPSSSSHPLSSP